MADKVAWDTLRAEYVRDGKASYRSLGEKYGVSPQTVAARARKEKWGDSRRAYREKAAEAAPDQSSSRDSGLAKLMTATEQAVDVVAQAFGDGEQFHRYLVKRREKYPAESPDGKARTEERQWTEEQRFEKLDTKAIRDLTAVLKDLTVIMRDFSGVPAARQRAGAADSGKEAEIRVVLEGETEDWAK